MRSSPSFSSAALWSALDIALGQGLRFAIAVVLARLLTPAEFGTVALLGMFIGIAGVFVESGLGQALIQRQDVTDEDISTVFWFNVVVSVAVAGLLAMASPAIADFFDKPVLVPLTMILAANIVISAFGAVHHTLFTKRLAFKPVMVIGAIATVVSGATAIACAEAGYGVWALAVQTVVAGLTTTLLQWVLSPWRPRFLFSIASARRLFGFGGYILAASLLEIAYSRAYTLLIGKLYGAADLGQYARADATTALPTTLLTGSVSRVVFSAFSTMWDDRERMVSGMRFSLQAMMLVQAPAMLGLAVVAKPLILTLYGDKWLPTVPILQVLCLAALQMPIHMLNVQALMALGRSDLCFRLEIAKKVVGIAILIVASCFGPLGIAWGVTISSTIALAINTSVMNAQLGYGARRQLFDVTPAILLAAVMAGGVALLLSATERLTEPTRLIMAIVFGGVLYGLLSILIRPPGFDALVQKFFGRPVTAVKQSKPSSAT